MIITVASHRSQQALDHSDGHTGHQKSILGGAYFQGTPSPACGWVSVFSPGISELHPEVPHCAGLLTGGAQ